MLGRLQHLIRRGGIVAMLFGLVIVLASCGSGSTYDPVDGTVKNPGKTVPPVMLQAIEGVPAGQLGGLTSALAVAAGQRDIGLVEGGGFQGGNFTLSGRLQAMARSADVQVVYQWQLRDAEGGVVHTVDGFENAGLFAGGDAWGAVTPATLERIARATADSLAGRLATLGFATRLAALYMPPPEYFVMAGVGAEREIDFETLNGPDPAMAATDGLGPEADVTAEASPEVAERTAQAEAAETPQKSVEAPQKPGPKGKFEIRAVAVLPVKGAGGKNDPELTSAMRRTLAAAGWPVVSRPQADAITIVGKVKMSKARDGGQDVSVRWEVKTPTGGQLGDVKQANRVPAGTLDAGWGDAAFAVAEAAAMGIFDIVKRYQ
ncbi:MAG: hypothetical protein KDK89_11055 [Alphaproteobacteria bacterium]|nr:hypothetical protein [Alphaproteobacteria bacterium]